jgi:hypothetical protein
MQLFSFLGSEEFYLFIAPFVYWCIDQSLGLRLAIGLIVSNWINLFLKQMMLMPRPYWISRQVTAWASESTFSLPSGHAQNAVVVWGLLAASVRRWWCWLISLFLIFMIGISRIFLAVHFPSDVIAGWLVGFIILVLFIIFEKPFIAWFRGINLSLQMILILAASLTMLLTGYLAHALHPAWTIPAEWVNNALSVPGGSQPDPLSLSGIISTAGAFLGLAAGAVLNFRASSFNIGGPWWKRLLRFLVGLMGVAILFVGLALILPGGNTLAGYTARYLRYVAVGLWVTAAAPWLFLTLHLSVRLPKA